MRWLQQLLHSHLPHCPLVGSLREASLLQARARRMTPSLCRFVLDYTVPMPCAVLQYRCTCCGCILLLHGKTVGGLQVGACDVQGYVMDGYPSNVRQAELLEGALTGLDLTAERVLIASASRLAPPRPATLPDLNRPLVSGLGNWHHVVWQTALCPLEHSKSDCTCVTLPYIPVCIALRTCMHCCSSHGHLMQMLAGMCRSGCSGCVGAG